MPEKKKPTKLLLTDLSLHAREFRPAQSLAGAVKTAAGAAPQGRFYANRSLELHPDGTFTVTIDLPPDVAAAVDAGEVELALPEGGLPVYLAPDGHEKLRQLQAKERRETIHRSRRGTWRAE